MTTLLICLFIAMLLPYAAKGPVAVAMSLVDRGSLLMYACI